MTENPDDVVDYPSTQLGLPLLTAHAYSAETSAPQTQSWRKTWGSATAMLVLAVVAAVAIVLLLFTPPSMMTASTTPPSTISAGDLPSIDSPAPPTSPFVAPSATAQHMVEPELPAPPKALPPKPQTSTCSSNGCDADYLWLLHHDGFGVSDAPLAITNAHLACANLAVTHDLYQTYRYMIDTVGVVDPFAKEIVTAGTTVYCPSLPY